MHLSSAASCKSALMRCRQRAYRLERRGHSIRILRADGSEFIELEPKATQIVHHRCGADVYAGHFLFRSCDEWAEAWRVKGPRKNYASLSRFHRVGGGQPSVRHVPACVSTIPGGLELVLRERIELSTSPLPRECSTTELPQPLMAGLLPYRTGKRKASVKGFARQVSLTWRRHNASYPLERQALPVAGGTER